MPRLDTSQNINSVQFKEQTSASSTPASGYDQLYAKSDGFYYRNSAGTEIKLATGAGGTISTTVEDSTTATVTDIVTLSHNSTGTPGAGFGAGLLFRSETNTTINTQVGRLRFHWTTVTHASRTARGTLSASDASAERDCIMWEASGSAPMVGFQGTAPIVKPSVTGSRGGNAALASLLTALANYGLITDSTTA